MSLDSSSEARAAAGTSTAAHTTMTAAAAAASSSARAPPPTRAAVILRVSPSNLSRHPQMLFLIYGVKKTKNGCQGFFQKLERGSSPLVAKRGGG